MALAFVADSTGVGTNVTDIQINHTVTAGAERIIIVAVSQDEPTDRVTGITWSGTAMTQALGQGTSLLDDAALAVYYILEANISTGAGTAVISFSKSVPRAAACLVEYTGASQASDPWLNSTWDFNVGKATSSNEVSSSDSDGLVLGFCAANFYGPIVEGDTERSQARSAGAPMNMLISEAAGTGGNVTMDYTHSDQAFVTAANCLQVPQALSIDMTGQEAIVVSSAHIGAVDDSNLTIIGVTAVSAASASIGNAGINEPIRGEMYIELRADSGVWSIYNIWDEFTGTDGDAPQTSSPNVGSWAITDEFNEMSIQSNRLRINGGGALNNPKMISSGFSRVNGQRFSIEVTPRLNTQEFYVGLFNSTTISVANAVHAFYTDANANIFYVNGGIATDSGENIAEQTLVTLHIDVHLGGGASFYVNGTLVADTSTDSTATMYVGITNTGSANFSDFDNVYFTAVRF